MTVHELRSQEAQHDESGAILRVHGRDAMQVELTGRKMTLGVDQGLGVDLFYLPATPKWDDGTLMEAELATILQPVITEIEQFWDKTAEFRIVAD